MVLYSVRKKPYSIIHIDSSIVVATKEAGVPAQPDPSGDPAVSQMLEEQYGAPIHVVHRIDRPVSGLILYARSRKAAALLSGAFKRGEIQRKYWAIVCSSPPAEAGTLRHVLATHRGSNKTYVTSSGGTEAELAYRLVSVSDRYWLLEIQLHTGRHHQIRAQLAAIGCPVRGDLKYGARRSIRGGGIGLHARELALIHPVSGEPVSYVAPPPDELLWSALTDRLVP